jgi:hypothetical protein
LHSFQKCGKNSLRIVQYFINQCYINYSYQLMNNYF